MFKKSNIIFALKKEDLINKKNQRPFESQGKISKVYVKDLKEIYFIKSSKILSQDIKFKKVTLK